MILLVATTNIDNIEKYVLYKTLKMLKRSSQAVINYYIYSFTDLFCKVNIMVDKIKLSKQLLVTDYLFT